MKKEKNNGSSNNELRKLNEEKLNKLFVGNVIAQLKGFCATVENNNNMTEAADNMYSTEATISRQVKALEDQLGIKLFKKTGKKLQLTPDGERLYRLGLPKLKSMQALFMEFQNEKKNDEEKVINIAAHHVLLSHVLPKYIKEFRDRCPEVRIWLHNINRDEALEKMRNYEVDFAIYPYDEVPVEFESKILFSFKPYLMMNKNNPLAKKKEEDITLEDLLARNNLNLGKNMTMPLMKDIIKLRNLKTDINLINGSWEILKGLIKEDLGTTGVTSLYVDKNDKDLLFKDASHIFPNTEYKLVFLVRKHINVFVKTFLEVLNKKF